MEGFLAQFMQNGMEKSKILFIVSKDLILSVIVVCITDKIRSFYFIVLVVYSTMKFFKPFFKVVLVLNFVNILLPGCLCTNHYKRFHQNLPIV
jgi:hypothetical protein